MPSNWLIKLGCLQIETQLKRKEKQPLKAQMILDPDSRALEELVNELFEFSESSFKDLTELADIVYYAASAVHSGLCTQSRAIKWINRACALMPKHEVVGVIKPIHAYRACIAKYTSRIDHGKNKVRESAVVALAVNEGFYVLPNIDGETTGIKLEQENNEES